MSNCLAQILQARIGHVGTCESQAGALRELSGGKSLEDSVICYIRHARFFQAISIQVHADPCAGKKLPHFS